MLYVNNNFLDCLQKKIFNNSIKNIFYCLKYIYFCDIIKCMKILSLLILQVVLILTSNIRKFEERKGKFYIYMHNGSRYELLNRSQYQAVIKNTYFLDSMKIVIKK